MVVLYTLKLMNKTQVRFWFVYGYNYIGFLIGFL